MAVKIQSQRDYLLTEVNIDIPCDLTAVDYLMRSIGGTGRIIAQYSEGGLIGVHIEQRSKIRDSVADKVRSIIGVATKEMNGR